MMEILNYIKQLNVPNQLIAVIIMSIGSPFEDESLGNHSLALSHSPPHLYSIIGNNRRNCSRPYIMPI
jgi:hypothetical protein